MPASAGTQPADSQLAAAPLHSCQCAYLAVLLGQALPLTRLHHLPGPAHKLLGGAALAPPHPGRALQQRQQRHGGVVGGDLQQSVAMQFKLGLVTVWTAGQDTTPCSFCCTDVQLQVCSSALHTMLPGSGGALLTMRASTLRDSLGACSVMYRSMVREHCAAPNRTSPARSQSSVAAGCCTRSCAERSARAAGRQADAGRYNQCCIRREQRCHAAAETTAHTKHTRSLAQQQTPGRTPPLGLLVCFCHQVVYAAGAPVT